MTQQDQELKTEKELRKELEREIVKERNISVWSDNRAVHRTSVSEFINGKRITPRMLDVMGYEEVRMYRKKSK